MPAAAVEAAPSGVREAAGGDSARGRRSRPSARGTRPATVSASGRRRAASVGQVATGRRGRPRSSAISARSASTSRLPWCRSVRPSKAPARPATLRPATTTSPGGAEGRPRSRGWRAPRPPPRPEVGGDGVERGPAPPRGDEIPGEDPRRHRHRAAAGDPAGDLRAAPAAGGAVERRRPPPGCGRSARTSRSGAAAGCRGIRPARVQLDQRRGQRDVAAGAGEAGVDDAEPPGHWARHLLDLHPPAAGGRRSARR